MFSREILYWCVYPRKLWFSYLLKWIFSLSQINVDLPLPNMSFSRLCGKLIRNLLRLDCQKTIIHLSLTITPLSHPEFITTRSNSWKCIYTYIIWLLIPIVWGLILEVETNPEALDRNQNPYIPWSDLNSDKAKTE